MSKSAAGNKVTYRMCLVIIVLFSILFLSSCSEQNQTSGPYKTMLEGVNAVVHSTDEDLIFASGAYLYENQEEFDNNQPAYSLIFYAKELDGNELPMYHYIVRDDIELAEEFNMPFVSEEMKKIVETAELQDQLKLIEKFEDLTHKVVDLAKEKDRQLDKEAFSAGYALSGHYEGSVFHVNTVGDQGLLQASYNTDTEELVVAESLEY
ncbi:hypothetical protein J0B03_07700 [Alkalibacter rhizosphaerae]|uniref:Uncharacterized protein n=1 Tax=Alkalibacter rhizosphaerae TaxID=2815577 RepID=A0A974XG70_9FIRM|nr:hypothetical protein [Alkalibacter rhizosphaerae]QSX07713.1 hypothetical protein J0B03_07700 [Alkalibacter rhizosphaerae]